MALLYSPPPNPAEVCPDFKLLTVDGKTLSLKDVSNSRLLAVLFICNHCPYVQAIEDRLLHLGKEYQTSDVAFVGVCANDPTDYPEDAPAMLLQRWKEKAYPFPYLIDADQTFAKACRAVCTPDLFVYDSKRVLRYRGRLDDSWKNPARVQKREMKMALDELLSGKTLSAEPVPSMGCSIKWKND